MRGDMTAGEASCKRGALERRTHTIYQHGGVSGGECFDRSRVKSDDVEIRDPRNRRTAELSGKEDELQ